MDFTEQEKKVIKETVELWHQFQKLPIEHLDDLVDVKFHIHALQNIVLSRLGCRIVNNSEYKL